MTRLAERIALVTGAGSGIGRAIAQDFSVHGARLIINDIDLEKAEETADLIRQAGGEAYAIQADVCSINDVTAMMEEVKSKFGVLDILVNNAGVIVRSDFRHMDEEKTQQSLETNLNGPIRCIREAFALLQQSQHGAIVNVSSVMAIQYLRQLSLYSVTKASIEALTRTVAFEFAPYGIRVNYVAPGYIDTKMTEKFLRNPHFKNALIEKTAQKRLGTPQHIAKAVTFLASGDAEFITGTGLTVDGGITLSIL
ncbi:MAG: SDR family oxidoreductase [Pseudomonadota bacterium]